MVITSQAAYTSQFSTFLRVSQNIYLHDKVIAPQDRSGKDPLPKYLQRMVAGFPQEGGSELEQKGEMQNLRGTGGINGIEISEHSDQR